VSSFVLMDPYWTLRTGSVPFWMTFNMGPSYRALERYLGAAQPFDEVHLMLFQHGVDAVDHPSGDEWERLLRSTGARWSTLGLHLDEHPLDFGHFARYDDALREHVAARFPLPAPLALDEFREFVHERGERGEVEIHDRQPAV
jgi:hypothetical protein